jgi:hypothetical protein
LRQPPEDALESISMEAARITFAHGKPAGFGTDIFADCRWHFIPLRTQRGTIGVVGVAHDRRDLALEPEERALLATLAEQTAVAIERASLAEEMMVTRNAAETERVRSILLASVSHDFRTPLASILGSATSLLDYRDQMEAKAQTALLEQIKSEAEGLDLMVRNLLAIARIDAGALELRKDWIDLREIVERVVSAVRRRLHNALIEIKLPQELPLIRGDAILIEQALGNVVTGAEALYADLGHFGRRPIQTAWLLVALPALMLNYLGQGALVLADPQAIANPFFLLYPDWTLIPMVALATAATVIASQAVITGAYSITREAVQLGLLPRFEIRHTSASLMGQIFVPRVNTLLLLGVLLLVLLFRSSSALASAYGIAVTGTMVVTSLLAFIVIWKVWRWSALAAGCLIGPFLLIEVTFLSANMLKVLEGGWVPLTLGAAIMMLMYTRRRGSRILSEKTRRHELPLADLVDRLEKNPPPRVPGTAVFLTADPQRAHRTFAQPQAFQSASPAERDFNRRARFGATGRSR